MSDGAKRCRGKEVRVRRDMGDDSARLSERQKFVFMGNFDIRY